METDQNCGRFFTYLKFCLILRNHSLLWHLPLYMAPWQSGLLYGSAKPWFIGSNPIGALKMFLSSNQENVLSGQSIPYEKPEPKFRFFSFSLWFLIIFYYKWKSENLSIFFNTNEKKSAFLSVVCHNLIGRMFQFESV